MKVGMTVPAAHPYEANEMALEMAVSMDLDSLWLVDHLMGAFHPELFAEMSLGASVSDPDAFYDPFCVSAALGRQSTIPIGLSVTDAIRRRAADVARSALTLQHLCQGGFNLGIGSGEAENLVPFGYPSDKRVGRTEEFLGELRHLLDTGRMPEGIGRTGIPLESAQGKPRVWVAGHRPRMLRLTGQYADGWIPGWAASPQEYGEMRQVVHQHAAAAGRQPPESGFVVPFIVGSSRDQIAEAVEREPLGMLIATFMSAEAWRRHGVEHPCGQTATGFDTIPHMMDPQVLREVAATIPFELFEEWVWAGNPEQLTEKMENYAKQGCEHVVLTNTTGLVGDPSEFQARMPDVISLRHLVGEL
jgi:phthiodiolone/phenolphthiodiolone dimycocerosates ketoreductase